MTIENNLREIINESKNFVPTIIKTMNDQEVSFSVIEDRTILGLSLSVFYKADSLLFLVEHKKYAGIETLLRTIFEASTILEFILKADTENRAKAYILSGQKKYLQMIETSKSNDKKGENIRRFTGMSITQLQNVLESTDKDKINSDFLELTGKNSADKWYMIEEGISSFEKLCAYISDEREAEYEIIYRILSQDTHGKNATDYFKIQEGQLFIVEPELDEIILRFLRGTVLNLINLVSDFYGLKDMAVEIYGEIVSRRTE